MREEDCLLYLSRKISNAVPFFYMAVRSSQINSAYFAFRPTGPQSYRSLESVKGAERAALRTFGGSRPFRVPIFPALIVDLFHTCVRAQLDFSY